MKLFETVYICRDAGSNRPTIVKASTPLGFSYLFSLAPELSNYQIMQLLPKLLDRELHGDKIQTKRGRRR